MEITLETIYQQLLDTKFELRTEMKADKDELKTDIKELKADIKELKVEVDSVKTWFISLSLSTILVVTAIITTVVTTQLN